MNYIQSIVVRQESIDKYACCSMRADDAKMVQSLLINNKLLFQESADYVVVDGDSIDINCGYCFEHSVRIVVKKTDSIVLWMPDFDNELYANIFEHGVLYMFREEYQQICAVMLDIPTFDAVLPLTKRDCANIAWFEAPESVKISQKYKLEKSTCLATNTSDRLEDIIARLEAMLKDYAQSYDLVHLERLEINDVTLFLDTPDYYEWKPLYVVGDVYSLRLDPGYHINQT